MKAHSKLHDSWPYRATPLFCRMAAAWAFGAMIAIAALSHAAQPAPARAAAPQMSHDLQLTKSLFVSAPGPGFGTDPFFPKTMRFAHVRTNTVEQPGPVSFLSLKGISVTRNR